MKTCYKCKEDKPFEMFHKSKTIKDGFASYCKPCKKAQDAQYRKDNPEKVAESQKKWAQANPEKVKAIRKKWKQANPEKKAAIDKKYEQANPHKKRAANAKRRATILKASGPWTDHKLFEEMSAECVRLEKLTGIKFHIDHSVPLQGKGVSGLHIEGNWEILTESDNTRKGNKWYWETQSHLAPEEVVVNRLTEK